MPWPNPFQFRHVWFFEDDVFIPRAELVSDMDARHPDADLLSSSNIVNHFGETKNWDWWPWVPVDILPLPWARSMACAVRMSSRLLFELDRTIAGSARRMKAAHVLSRQKKGPQKFLFIEFLFNTVALLKRLKAEQPDELSSVLFHKIWHLEELDDRHIYHPVKGIGSHDEWRQIVIGKPAP